MDRLKREWNQMLSGYPLRAVGIAEIVIFALTSVLLPRLFGMPLYWEVARTPGGGDLVLFILGVSLAAVISWYFASRFARGVKYWCLGLVILLLLQFVVTFPKRIHIIGAYSTANRISGIHLADFVPTGSWWVGVIFAIQCLICLAPLLRKRLAGVLQKNRTRQNEFVWPDDAAPRAPDVAAQGAAGADNARIVGTTPSSTRVIPSFLLNRRGTGIAALALLATWLLCLGLAFLFSLPFFYWHPLYLLAMVPITLFFQFRFALRMRHWTVCFLAELLFALLLLERGPLFILFPSFSQAFLPVLPPSAMLFLLVALAVQVFAWGGFQIYRYFHTRPGVLRQKMLEAG